MNQQNKLSKFTIKKMLLMFALIPLFVTTACVIIITSLSFRNISRKDNLAYLESLTIASGQRLEVLVEEEGVNVLNNYEKLSAMFSNVGINGIESSYVYIVDQAGTMMYHPTPEKIGQPVENEVITGVVADITDGKVITPSVVMYEFKGTIKYAAYYCNPTNDFILVISANESEVLSTTNNVMITIIGISLGVTVLFVFIAIFFARVFTKPLNKVTENLGILADGDLTKDMSVHSTITETQKLIHGTQTINSNLGNIVRKVSDVSNTVMDSSANLKDTANSTLSASEEIAKAIEDVALNNTKQAGLINDIAGNINVIQEKASDITISVKGIEDCSADLTDNCNHMRAKIDETSVSNNVLSNNINLIQEKIETTNQTIKKMSEILTTIEDIASKTKLLSLNASIEAARAGEFGRGFTVVADNIRTLATSTAEELISVKEIITTITKDFSECIEYAKAVVENNVVNQQNISEVTEMFDSMNKAINNTSEQVNIISKAVLESNQQIDRITEEIVVLGDVAESNAATSEEVNASVEELTALMHNVEQDSDSLTNRAKDLMISLSNFTY